MTEIVHKELSYKIQGAFFAIYKTLGNAHKESVYHRALLQELANLKLTVDDEKRIDVYYNNTKIGVYVPDIVIEEKILVEIKAKPRLIQEDIKQFWQYLRASEYHLGYLVNFGSPGKVEIIRRVYDTARI